MALKLAGSILLGSFLIGNPICKKMTTLSYRIPSDNPDESWLTARYTKGTEDLFFVGFWIIAFTWFRAFIMKGYLNALGKRLGIRGSKLERFEEQGYIVLYYIISWTAGMVCMTRNYARVSIEIEEIFCFETHTTLYFFFSRCSHSVLFVPP